MQGLAGVLPAEFRAAGQQPLLKLEIWVGAAWINLNNLGGKNYVQDISISLGGASMTPRPVEGTWNATIFNKDGVFHPDHPTSLYKDYLKTERRVRISVGAMYGGVPVYWPRIIGYMDVPKFSAPDMNVAISGGDYMKRLRETELRRPNNYWGDEEPYDSIDSEGRVGVELYADNDAMNPADDGAPPYNNVANWVTTGGCTFVHQLLAGPYFYVGKYVSITNWSYVRHPAVCNVVAGTRYVCTFRAKRVVGTSVANVWVAQDVGGTLTPCPALIEIGNDAWTNYTFYFTGIVNGPLIFTLNVILGGQQFRIDQISIHAYTPYWKRYYELNGGFATPATGPYYVTLDSGAGAIPCWQGEGDEDWKYDADLEAGPDPPAHPAKIVYFNLNKIVPRGGVGTVPGADNLVIYYFTATSVVDVIARLLWQAGVCDPTTDEPYASENAAKTRIEAQAPIYVDPAIDIDKVWFEAGTNCLNAIKKICERCNYRFYFDYDGYPIFRPKPTWVGVDFTFTDPKHIATISTYQDQNEIKNRIIIKGIKQADAWNKEETMPSYLTGEASDGASILAYGERTMTINNHLFQTQVLLDAMCVTLKDEYHEPKWYSDLEIPFNPVPLELGDNIQWEEMLSPTLDITQEGIIRDIKIDGFSVTYKCVLK